MTHNGITCTLCNLCAATRSISIPLGWDTCQFFSLCNMLFSTSLELFFGNGHVHQLFWGTSMLAINVFQNHSPTHPTQKSYGPHPPPSPPPPTSGQFFHQIHKKGQGYKGTLIFFSRFLLWRIPMFQST